MPLWLAYNQKDHPCIDILKIKDYITSLFGLGLKGWNVGKGYGIMCSALGSAWGTPENLGNTVGASCQTIGNFMGHLGARVNQHPQSWHLHFLEWGLLVAILTPNNVRNWPLWMPVEPFHWLHEVSMRKTGHHHFYFMPSS